MDGSSSMLQPWNASPAIRFAAGARIVEALMDSLYSINSRVEFGLRVYGNQSPAQEKNCFDSRREVSFSKDNRAQMALRLASIEPLGVSPIAWSLKEAAENDLVNEQQNAYSIILITDGGESCNGNICDVVQRLLDKKIFFKPYVLSLVDDAPLQKTYECLGNYLVVTKEPDVPAAIKKLVDAYRPLLTMPTIISRPDQVPTPILNANPLPVVIIPTPAVRERDSVTLVLRPAILVIRRPEWRSGLRISAVPQVAVAIVVPNIARPVDFVPGIAKPRRREVEWRSGLRISGTRLAPVAIVVANVPRPVDFIPTIAKAKTRTQEWRPDLRIAGTRRSPVPIVLPDIPRPVVDTTPRVVVTPPRPKETVSFIPKIVRSRLPPPVWRPALRVAGTFRPVPRIAPPSVVPRTRDTVAKITPRAAPRSDAGAKTQLLPFTTSAEPAEATTLLLYFTDGRGVFYHTSPQVTISNIKTGDSRKFYRTVNPSNEPDPQPVVAGTYTLSIVGKSVMNTNNIVIEPSKANKVVITVTGGTLRFAYQGNPGRPMIEFEAIVNRRFEPGPTIRQHCDAELPYEPGNYYVEVNTLPVTRFNTDIDFGAMTELQIQEPGWVQFENTNNVGKAFLFRELGDQYMKFYTMDVPGVPASQKVRLKPGPYEVHYVKSPGTPAAKEAIVRFSVESNKTTLITLP